MKGMLNETDVSLKLHKHAIFDGLDFGYFYTIKPFWVGALGAKIQIHYFNI
jgi:hypothetical protein